MNYTAVFKSFDLSTLLVMKQQIENEINDRNDEIKINMYHDMIIIQKIQFIKALIYPYVNNSCDSDNRKVLRERQQKEWYAKFDKKYNFGIPYEDVYEA